MKNINPVIITTVCLIVAIFSLTVFIMRPKKPDYFMKNDDGNIKIIQLDYSNNIAILIEYNERLGMVYDLKKSSLDYQLSINSRKYLTFRIENNKLIGVDKDKKKIEYNKVSDINFVR